MQKKTTEINKKADRGSGLARLKERLDQAKERPGLLQDLSAISLEAIIEKIAAGKEPTGKTENTIENQFLLETQINELKDRVKGKTRQLTETIIGRKKQDELIRQLKDDIVDLQKKERIRFLVSRVNEDARKKLFESEKFVKLFLSMTECDAVVLSMDIRRSTDLMLKAKKPEAYAEFITSLTSLLSGSVMDNYGIYEKFTGDGILAFFPLFYSGPDAFLLALNAAEASHDIFTSFYREQKKVFRGKVEDTGIGIGIDFGRISMTTINGDLSIVGEPVVYACRFASAPSGKTFLHQRAVDFGVKKYGDQMGFDETLLEVKHEGSQKAFELSSMDEGLEVKIPDWDQQVKRFF